MANTWPDDQQMRDALAACHVLATGIPYTKQADHGAGETCGQVINRLGRNMSSKDSGKLYASQEALKHGHGVIRAFRAGQGIKVASGDHANGTEPCVVTICRVAGIPF